MSAIIERRLMLRYGMKYCEARTVTSEVRDKIGLNRQQSSEELEEACFHFVEEQRNTKSEKNPEESKLSTFSSSKVPIGIKTSGIIPPPP